MCEENAGAAGRFPETLGGGLDLLGGYAGGKFQAVAVDVQH
jgi:hypothetical protein